ncbi:MAG: PDDEXK nuclease domain-containing protein [Verrucomicrobiia bacterium]
MKYAQLIKAIDSTSRQLLGRAAAAVNQSLVIRNWLIGAYIVEFEQCGEDRAKYGARLLERLATDLTTRGLRGLDARSLRDCRRLFQIYPQIRGTLSPKSEPFGLLPMTGHPPAIRGTLSLESPTPLSARFVLRFSWSQLQELIRLDAPLKRAFYENECLKSNWSVRQLQRQIGSLLFERTGLSKNKGAVIQRAQRQELPQSIEDLIRDPYILEFTGLGERPQYTESDLETALLDHLQKFLLELGAGFLFEARQRRITIGNEHDYIDLVFYHRHLRCYVLLDLKTRPFRHGDAGQMNFYLNWWKENVTHADEQPPIGILLCSDKDHTKVEFATAGMANKLFVSRYLTALPSAEQLQRFVETDRARVEADMEQSVRSGAKPAAKSKRKKTKPSRCR